jgi:hypothetical protein
LLSGYLIFHVAQAATFGTNARAGDAGCGWASGQTHRIKNAVNPSREGHVMEYEIEAVARALYSVEDDAQVWEHEPEIVKEAFREHARTALAMLAQFRRQERYDRQAVPFPYAA